MVDHVLGIDIGGSGVKAAPVDVATGQLAAERVRLATPQPSTPDAVSAVVTHLVKEFSWIGHAGVTFPGVVVNCVIHTSANVEPSWVGVDRASVFRQATARAVTPL